MKDLAAGERLGRKFTCAPFIPHGRGLKRSSTDRITMSQLGVVSSFDFWVKRLKVNVKKRT